MTATSSRSKEQWRAGLVSLLCRAQSSRVRTTLLGTCPGVSLSQLRAVNSQNNTALRPECTWTFVFAFPPRTPGPPGLPSDFGWPQSSSPWWEQAVPVKRILKTQGQLERQTMAQTTTASSPCMYFNSFKIRLSDSVGLLIAVPVPTCGFSRASQAKSSSCAHSWGKVAANGER